MIADAELIAAANSAVIMVRAPNHNPMSIGTMYAAAQVAIGRCHEESFVDTPRYLYDEEAALPLIAAARTLHTISLSQKHREVERPIIIRTTLLAAVTYAMYGNFPSAATVLNEIADHEFQTEVQVIAAAICNPSSIGRLLDVFRLHFTPVVQRFFESLNRYLYEGDGSTAGDLRKQIDNLSLQFTDVFDSVLMAGLRVALAHVVELSVTKAVGAQSRLTKDFARSLVAQGRPCLLPSQFALLVGEGFASASENAIVTLPTSGGKTLLAEFAIVAALSESPGLALYVVPYNALGNQVYDTLVKHLPPEISVRRMFGGFKGPSSSPTNLREVIVATPERADALLRSGNYYHHIRIAVFDEAHVIENGSRGARLESIITRLRLKQYSGARFRLVLLSAVLNEVSGLCQWLGLGTRHFTNSWRPTARRIAIWESSGTLNWIYGNDPLRPIGKGGGDSLVRNTLPWPAPLYPAEDFARIKSQQASAFLNVAYLVRFTTSLLGGPTLVLCGTKANTRGVAESLALALSPIQNVPTTIDRIVSLIATRYPYLKQLSAMCLKGVAYHNSALPSDVKELIEKAVKVRDIQYVAATTTLAEGVDLPFRVTIIFDWLVGFGASQRPMAPLLFRNIAGRCGRAGEFVEGDTVIFDNVLGNLRYTRDTMRAAAQTSIIADPQPLTSAIANDNQLLDERRVIEAVLSSQLLATIPEHPTVSDVDQILANNLYAAFTNKRVNDLLKTARAEVLDDKYGEPFARAASPMVLTTLGRSANATGLSARSCRVVISYLVSMKTERAVENLSADLIAVCGSLPEQASRMLEKIGDGTIKRSFISSTDIPTLCSAWMSGEPFEEVFVKLPKAVKSSAAVKPATWIRGDAQSESVAAQYDKFIELMEYTFGFFLPWMFRACGQLASSVTAPVAQVIDWQRLAREMEEARFVRGEVLDGLDAE